MDMATLRKLMENLTPSQREEIFVDTTKHIFELRQKRLDGHKLSDEEEIVLSSIGPLIDKRLQEFGEEWLRENGIVPPKPRVVDGVYIESTCPHCSIFAVYEVERGVDSVVECRSCRGKMRVRLGSK